jgi:drug/metabolite transporter (DMT)-like permease
MTSSGLGNAPPAGADLRTAPRTWHVFVLLWVGMLWGIEPALIKFATARGLSEIASLALVLTSIALTLGVVLAARGRLFRPTRLIFAFMLISGVMEYVAPLLITFHAAQHVDAGVLTLIISTAPIFTVALAAAVGSEGLSRESVLACVSGVAAMALIVVPVDTLPDRDTLPWLLGAFVVPVLYACGSVYVARAWPAGFDPVQVAFCGSAMASVMLAPFSLGPLLRGHLFALSLGTSGALLALAVSVVLEMILYFYLLQNAGPVFTSFSSFIMISSGFVAGAVLFGEQPSLWVWASVVLFTLSLALIIKAPRGGG